MELVKGKNNYILHLRSITWYKDSHSLYDYESNKINTNSFSFPLSTKNIVLYRKRDACTVVALDPAQQLKFVPEGYQFLTKFEIKPHNNKYRLHFLNDCDKQNQQIANDRQKTDESSSSILANAKEEETYLIVRKQKNINGEHKGYKLEPGQTIKIGRVQFFVSEVCIDDQVVIAKSNRQKLFAKKLIHKYSPKDYDKRYKTCKICLDDTQTTANFLFNPCKCSGSCGTVHIECLLQWISVKVKKEVIGGTLHYNFQKFECQVCKSELPIIIETESGQNIQLLAIEKPQGSYLILEGACEKTQSVMMIKNVPEAGIKLGRGHECEIRITDISVSRSHAFLKFNGTHFSIFDNKSKFGTLVKQPQMDIELANGFQQGIQVGRTIILFDLLKQNDLKEKKETEKQIKNLPSKKHISSK